MEVQNQFNLAVELLLFMDTVRKSGQDLRSQIHNFHCPINNMTNLMRDMLRCAGLDADQLNSNLEGQSSASRIDELPITDEFYSRSKTTALKVSKVADSQEIPALEDDVSSESTIKDSVIADSGQIIDFPDSYEILSCANTVKHSADEEDGQNEENDCNVLGKMDDTTNACKVYDEMPEPFQAEYLLSTKVTNAAHYMFDNMPTLFPVISDERSYGITDSLSPYPYVIETGSSVNGSCWISGLITNISKVNVQYLSYMDVVLGVSETNSPSLQKLGFSLQVFDPGTLSLLIVYAQTMPISVESTTDLNKAWIMDVTLRINVNLGTNVMVDEAFENLLDGLKGFDSLPMLTFDPGIGYWHLTCCVPLMSSEMPNSGCQWPQMNCYRKDVTAYSYTGAFVLTLSGKGNEAGVDDDDR